MTGELVRLPRSRASKVFKTIAVTGGAGFVGSHLCTKLVAAGHKVVCLDNFHTGRAANVAHLVGIGGFEIIEHDVADIFPTNLPMMDEIYNLACPASPVHYSEDPVKTALTCSLGALMVLRRAERDGAAVLQASTSEIYGDPEVHPQREDYVGHVNTVGPRSCYDEGKRFAETLMTDYGRRAGIPVRIARIFNTYGPGMQPDDGRVISNFIVQALAGEDITVFGEGTQTRSFCYVSDLVDGLVSLMENAPEGTGPVNLGNPTEMEVGALARLIVQMTGSSSRVVGRPLPVDDPRRRRPDITKAAELLSWSPKVPLAEGLERTIAYFEASSANRTASQDGRVVQFELHN